MTAFLATAVFVVTYVLIATERVHRVTDVRLVQSLVVLALTMVAFVLHTLLHLEPSMVALLGAGLLVATTPVKVQDAIRDVEWPTLVFFMGLFVVVGGLIEAGVVDRIADAPGDATRGDLTSGSMLLLGASGVLSGLIDNIPYVTTMSPVVAELVAGAQGDGRPERAVVGARPRR